MRILITSINSSNPSFHPQPSAFLRVGYASYLFQPPRGRARLFSHLARNHNRIRQSTSKWHQVLRHNLPLRSHYRTTHFRTIASDSARRTPTRRLLYSLLAAPSLPSPTCTCECSSWVPTSPNSTPISRLWEDTSRPSRMHTRRLA